MHKKLHTVTQKEIERGLTDLGVRPGMNLLVHSSLSSLGPVAGGANTVIDALLQAIVPNGTLLMPTHPARDGQTFDPKTIPSDMGTISETFRQRPRIQRSRHPYHPVAALGPDADRLLRDHELSAVPDGDGTPYGRLISADGFVLLVGCDLDNLTLLHTVEASLDLAYLRQLEMEYVDASDKVQRLEITRCPGGHRGGVLKFDRLFRREGAMQVGRIGSAVCRLISALGAAAIMAREMYQDPCFALDENPNCADCVQFRGHVAARGGNAPESKPPPAKNLKDILGEDFELTVAVIPPTEALTPQLEAVSGAGLNKIELSLSLIGEERALTSGLAISAARATWEELRETPAWPHTMATAKCQNLRLAPPQNGADRERFIAEMSDVLEACKAADTTVLLANAPNSIASQPDQLARLIEQLSSDAVKASYDPAVIARKGGSPFYGELYKGPLRKHIEHLDFIDVIANTGDQTVPGSGHSQVVEILSNLRCRSYRGTICLWPLPPDRGGLGTALEAFQKIMGRI